MIRSISIILLMSCSISMGWNSTNLPGQTHGAGWNSTNNPTPGSGDVVPDFQPGAPLPIPYLNSYLAHIAQTTNAHGGIVASPTNTPSTGWALLWAPGRPYWGVIDVGGVSFHNITGAPADNDALNNYLNGFARSNQLGSKADLCGILTTTNYSVRVDGGGTLVGNVASLVISSSVSFLAGVPISSVEFASDSSGLSLQVQYWHGGWTNELINPCYTARVFATSMGIPSLVTNNTIMVSNWVIRAWGTCGELRQDE